ncbi:hypothetical protein ABPG74_004104 [Tetrahymena malaccensis]
MVQLEQNKMRKEDLRLLLMPDLKEANEVIFKIKKNYNLIILVSLMLSRFSIKLTKYAISDYNQKLITDQNLVFIVQFIFGNMFSQITIGFLVDLVSVEVSWIFTWFISILAISLNLIQLCVDIDNIYLLGSILTICSYVNNYIAGSFIIYNSSYALNIRFNQGVLFVVIGSYASKCLFVILKEFTQMQKSVYVYTITFCLFANILTGVIIIYAYNKIEKVKKNQIDYQIFLRYQGVGLKIKSIFYYYFNKNMIFLAIQTLVGGIIGYNSPQQLLDILRLRQGDWVISEKYYTFFLNSQHLGCLFFIYFIFNLINSSRQFIRTQYLILKIIMIISFAVYLVTSIILIINEYIPFIFLLTFFQLLLIYQGVISLLSATVSFQINYCLQDEKCSIKCIGLGLLGFIQDLPLFIQIIHISADLFYGIQTSIILLSLLYNNKYLSYKQFDEIEENIQQQYQIQKS